MTFCDFSIDNRSLGVDKGLFAPGSPGVSVNDLARKLPEDIAVKIAYNPLIIEDMCFYYVELMPGEFAKLKINKKEGRLIRKVMAQRDRELSNMASNAQRLLCTVLSATTSLPMNRSTTICLYSSARPV